VAYDTGAPRLQATAEVFITVLRNLNGPIFNPQIYRLTIDETTPVQSYIQKLTVSDPDGVRYYTNMDFLAVEYDVICTEKINIDRGDSRGQY
jgi:hypothetical protein